MFDIKLTYWTGNSFGTHRESDFLNVPMPTIEIAKENLLRIKTHYETYLKANSYSRSILKFDYPDFYVRECGEGNLKYSVDGIRLKTVGDKEHIIYSPFWIGYFERLESAEIVAVDPAENDLIVYF